MYRPRSTDVWFNMPGVVAAWQPVAAPGPLAARYNQAQGGSNVYQAVNGVAPTWSGAVGWTFNGSTQYLNTGVVATNNQSWTAFCAFTDATTNGGHLLGTHDGIGNTYFILRPKNGSNALWANGNYAEDSPYMVSGVMAVSGASGYRNGVLEVTCGTAPGTWSRAIYIGAANAVGTALYFQACKIQSVVISSVTLSAAAVGQYSRQMAYCHVNPEWSAWGRRRRYYYAPSAAGFQAAWAARANRLIGGGADRV